MADESEDDASKTEEPTQKKLDEARKRGEVTSSREVNHWFMIFGATLFVMLLSPLLLRQLGNGLQGLVTQSDQYAVDTLKSVGEIMWPLLKLLFLALALPFLLFIVSAVAGSLMQVGPMWAPEHLEPKLERISIQAGFGRLFSRQTIVEFLKGLLKIVIVGVVVFSILWPAAVPSSALLDQPPASMLTMLSRLSLKVLGAVLAVMFIIAVLDYLMQRLMFMLKMRMSRTELKEEYKQSEGDPQIKQKIRQIRSERARRRMMANVPKADVVITNPDHYAIALEYKPPEMSAPVVVAMGVDLIAQKIKEVARENDIPIVENPPLARALYATADIEREIPHEHYRAVAEIISYVYKLKKQTGGRKPS